MPTHTPAERKKRLKRKIKTKKSLKNRVVKTKKKLTRKKRSLKV